MKRVDAIIIGFGKGGKILAADLAKRNWEVAEWWRRFPMRSMRRWLSRYRMYTDPKL